MNAQVQKRAADALPGLNPPLLKWISVPNLFAVVLRGKKGSLVPAAEIEHISQKCGAQYHHNTQIPKTMLDQTAHVAALLPAETPLLCSYLWNYLFFLFFFKIILPAACCFQCLTLVSGLQLQYAEGLWESVRTPRGLMRSKCATKLNNLLDLVFSPRS